MMGTLNNRILCTEWRIEYATGQFKPNPGKMEWREGRKKESKKERKKESRDKGKRGENESE